MNEAIAVHWTTVAAFWATVVVAIVAVGATVVNYFMFRIQVDPNVVVYATPDEDRPSVIILVIENIGKGVAKEVSFTLSRALPVRAFGFDDAPMPATMTEGPLITGIPSLGPGAKRVITWGQYGGVRKGIGDDVITVRARYRGDRIGPFEPKWYDTDCQLDIMSFHGTDASDSNWERKTAGELKRIADILHRVSGGFGRLRIEVIAQDDQTQDTDE